MCKHELSQGQIEKSIVASSQYTTKYQSWFTSWPSLKGKHIKPWMMPFTRIFKQVLHFRQYRNRAMPCANFLTHALKDCFVPADIDSGRQQGWGSPPWEKCSALMLACTVSHTHVDICATDIQTTVWAILSCLQPPRHSA